MPELPEVETVRRGLEGAMAGQTIASVELRRADLRWPFPERMEERLTGASILRFGRLGKYILADLSTGETLIIHLGMSGSFSIFDAARRLSASDFGAHDHVVFVLSSGTAVLYNDPRRFGMMDLTASAKSKSHRLLCRLGPEPLSPEFTPAVLHQSLSCTRASVKAALLDQRRIAGLGNIYVCESLWLAGISPLCAAFRVSAKQAVNLADSVRRVLNAAIAAGGSSLRDHRHPEGSFGYFQHSFSVYGRAGEPCLRSACPGTVERLVQSGRATFFCRECQC